MPEALATYRNAGFTSSVLTRFAYEPSRQAQDDAQAIRLLASRDDALGRGVRGLLYAWQHGHRSNLQPCDNGRWYIETCPAYIATVDGVSKWSARIAWTAVEEILDWQCASVQHVKSLGIKLRTLARGVRRGGRHLLLNGEQVAALDLAAATEPRHPATGYQRGPNRPSAGPGAIHPPRGRWLRARANTAQIQRLGRTRTVAVTCPAHQDRDPSLVLWSNGGAMCMSCGWRASWKIDGDQLFVKAAACENRVGESAHGHPITTTNTPSRPCIVASGPVGGQIATRSTNTRHAGSSLTEWQGKDGEWRRSRSAGHRLAGDLLDVLVRAEARSLGVAAEKAAEAAFYGDGIPDRAIVSDKLVSTGCVVRSGGQGWIRRWTATVQRWVLIDLDDLHYADPSFAASFDASRLGDALRNDAECSGRFAVVETSHTGLQVWVELAQARFNPEQWFCKPEVREWYSALANRMLSAVHLQGVRGGHVDHSSCGSGRWGRRPGWRMKQGRLFRATLLHVEDVCDG